MSISKSNSTIHDRGPRSGPLSRTDHREIAENYQGELFRYGVYRIAVCRDGIQWLFQRQRPQFPAGRAAWDTLGYCVSKSGLMGAIHQATMMMARRLNHVETLQQQDSAERALNKLARTFTSQVETLKRYRSKADQTVRVERVEVKEGGQAIVGNVETGGGKK